MQRQIVVFLTVLLTIVISQRAAAQLLLPIPGQDDGKPAEVTQVTVTVRRPIAQDTPGTKYFQWVNCAARGAAGRSST